MKDNLASLTNRIEQLETRQQADRRLIQRLDDIEQIKQLKYRYFRAMDTADMVLLSDTLTENFMCRFQGGSYTFNADSRAQFVEMISIFFNDKMAAQHQGHHPEIDIISEGEAAGTWYLQDVVHFIATSELMAGTLFYNDRYVRTPGGWRLSYSEYKRVVETRGPVSVAPTYTARHLAIHGRKISTGTDPFSMDR